MSEIITAYQENPFIERNREPLAETLEYIGHDPNLVDDIEKFVHETQPYTKGDHVRPMKPVVVADEHTARLHELYGQMGLKHEQHLPLGHYDYILVLGAIMIGNVRRLEMTNRTLDRVSVGQIAMLGGERPVFPEQEEILIEHKLDELRKMDSLDDWSVAATSARQRINWETDMVRLSAALHLGPMTTEVPFTPLAKDDEYPETQRMYIQRRNGLVVDLMHTQASSRPGGADRHSTKTVMEHWVELFQPEQGAKVGFITANPHTERTGVAAANALRDIDRDDIILHLAGSGAAETMKHSIFIGEMSRNLYENLQLANRTGQVFGRSLEVDDNQAADADHVQAS